ncbi:hypothetical protein ACFYPX_08855 [Micromonospora zamorensis]|uniref:hypothetical protein n=1 Tax=Micromonospora zamorensis TaxID=709883 RepID=UPI0036AF4428
MTWNEQVEAEARQVKAALPGYLGVREMAAAALAGAADDLGLELRERDRRDLAVAVVDAIHKAAELHGIKFACDVADMEVSANDRWLLAPAREKAKTDADTRAVLPRLEQYAEGAQEVRNELVERLARVGRQWLADQPAAVGVRTEARAAA